MLVIGINHKTAELCFRELLSFSKEVLQHALSNLFMFTKNKEVALVSTCNRTEIYTSNTKASVLFAWLEQYCGVRAERLQQAVYVYKNDLAIRHLMKVACGLDSQIIGESQILGQLKYSYALAKELGTIDKKLSRLFETTFSVAKAIRANTLISYYPISIASLILKKSKQFMPDLASSKVLLLGAGKMSQLCAEYFYKKGTRGLYFANRTFKTAQQLANKYNAKAYELQQVSQILPEVDIVVVATGAHEPILKKLTLIKALASRKQVSLCVFDLAMPRNVESEVGELPGVILYNIDELQSIAENNVTARKKELSLASGIIENHVSALMAWLRVQKHVGVIQNYRRDACMVRDNEVNKALDAVMRGNDPQQVISLLGYQLTNKLLHKPTIALHKVTRGTKKEVLAACELLGIEPIKEAE